MKGKTMEQPESFTIFTQDLKVGMKFELGGQLYTIIKAEDIKNDVGCTFVYVTFVLFGQDLIPENGNIFCMQHGKMFDVYA
jgi:hypothetical protein